MSFAPFFEKAPSIIFKPDGSCLLECLCNGTPQPEVKWYLKDTELVGDRYINKVKKMVGKYTCTLQIKDPQQSDQGVIRVVATNPKGSHFVEQHLSLKQVANEVFKSQ